MTSSDFVCWLVARGLMQSDVRKSSVPAASELGIPAADEALKLVTDHAVEGTEIGFVVLSAPHRLRCGNSDCVVLAYADADPIVLDCATGQVAMHDGAKIDRRMCGVAASGAKFLDALVAFYDGWMVGARGRSLIDQCVAAAGMPDAQPFFAVLIGG